MSGRRWLCVGLALVLVGAAVFAVRTVSTPKAKPTGASVALQPGPSDAATSSADTLDAAFAADQGGAPNPSEAQPPCSSGPPVNCATGTLWEQYEDFSLPEPGLPLTLVRTYSSADAGVSSPFGFGWHFSFGMSVTADAVGVTVHQENGATVTFTKDSSGAYTAAPRVLAALTAGPGGGYTFTRDASRTGYVFDSTQRLVAVHYVNGETVTMSYGPTGELATVTENGRSLAFTYAGSHISEVTDPLGRSVAYGYDSAGDLTSVTDASHETWAFTYFADHRLESATDPSGLLTSASYDARGRVIRETDAPTDATATWKYAGDPYGASGTTIVTDPDGHVTKYSFTAMRLTSAISGFGTLLSATTSYTYNAAGLVTGVTDANHNTTNSAYDAGGDLLSTTDALRHTTKYTYNDLGEPLTIAMPSGATTNAAYDSAGDLTSMTDPLGNRTAYEHGTAHPDDITQLTDPLGRVTKFAYYPNGDLKSMTDAAGDTTEYTYDADGEVTCEAAPDAVAAHIACPAAGTTRYAYDALGRVISAVDPAGGMTRTAYQDRARAVPDATDPQSGPSSDDGETTTVTDPLGNATAYVFNSAGQLAATLRADGSSTRTSYDADGNPVVQIDAAGAKTKYSYDALGRVASVTDPMGQTTSYAYDAVGNLTTTTDPSDRQTAFVYDAADDLTSISYSDGTTPDVVYTYTADGRRDSMTDGTGVTTYAYDGDGRLETVSGPAGVLAYGYDVAGQETSLTYPNGKSVQQKYDAAGRLSAVTDWFGGASSFTYNSVGSLISEAYPNEVTAAYSASGITDTASGTVLAAFGYARDADQRVTRETDALPDSSGAPTAAAVRDYTYTQLGQLKSWGGLKYTYDSTGDVTAFPGGTVQTFNAGGEITGSGPSEAATHTTYSYDAEGERTATDDAGATTTLGFDQAGRLTSYAASASYTYSGDGLRATKSVTSHSGTARHKYTWEVGQAAPSLLGDGTDWFVYGPNGRPIEQIPANGDGGPGAVTYLQSDAQGSTRLLTDAHGDPVGAYSYGPYGRPYDNHWGVSTVLQYDGQYTDAESGFQDLRDREYDPVTGAFLTSDPQGALTRTPYSYAGDDPLDQQDPTGASWYNPLSWTKKTWEGIGVVALIGVAVVGVTVLTGGTDLVVAGGAGIDAAEGGIGFATEAEAEGASGGFFSQAQKVIGGVGGWVGGKASTALKAARGEDEVDLENAADANPGSAENAASGPASDAAEGSGGGGGGGGRLLRTAANVVNRSIQVYNVYNAVTSAPSIVKACLAAQYGACVDGVFTLADGAHSAAELRAGAWTAYKNRWGSNRSPGPR